MPPNIARTSRVTGKKLVLVADNQNDTVRSNRALPQVARADLVFIEQNDALNTYPRWAAPVCIIADGPYGLGKFPGEPKTPVDLAEWYAPHVAAWSANARTPPSNSNTPLSSPPINEEGDDLGFEIETAQMLSASSFFPQ